MGLRDLTYTETITMVTETCCNCGVAFGIPRDLQQQFKNDESKWFYCPNGHKQHYSESEATRLERLLEKERRDHETRLQREIDSRKVIEHQVKRMHKGVCPCCNRSFPNLARHLKTKHPELVGKAKETAAVHKKINAKQA